MSWLLVILFVSGPLAKNTETMTVRTEKDCKQMASNFQRAYDRTNTVIHTICEEQ